MIRKVKKQVPRYVRNCLYCGREFKACRPGTMYCCSSHRSSYSQGYRVPGVDDTKIKLRNIERKMVEHIGPQGSNRPEDPRSEFKKELLVDLRKLHDNILKHYRNNDSEALKRINDQLAAFVSDD